MPDSGPWRGEPAPSPRQGDDGGRACGGAATAARTRGRGVDAVRRALAAPAL